MNNIDYEIIYHESLKETDKNKAYEAIKMHLSLNITNYTPKKVIICKNGSNPANTFVPNDHTTVVTVLALEQMLKHGICVFDDRLQGNTIINLNLYGKIIYIRESSISERYRSLVRSCLGTVVDQLDDNVNVIIGQDDYDITFDYIDSSLISSKPLNLTNYINIPNEKDIRLKKIKSCLKYSLEACDDLDDLDFLTLMSNLR